MRSKWRMQLAAAALRAVRSPYCDSSFMILCMPPTGFSRVHTFQQNLCIRGISVDFV